MIYDETDIKKNTSTVELVRYELASKKEGNVQQTINNIVVAHGRNKKNVQECFRLFGQTGIIKVTELGTWKYIAQDE